MANKGRTQLAFLCAIAGGILLLAAVAGTLWYIMGMPSRAAKQNFTAVAEELFSLPDPVAALLYEQMDATLTKEEEQTLTEKVATLPIFEDQIAPYCTEKGREMVVSLNQTLGRSCAGTDNITKLQSVTFDRVDSMGYYPFTATLSYGPAGQTGETVTFVGTVGFDTEGLLDECNLPQMELTEFVQKTNQSTGQS